MRDFRLILAGLAVFLAVASTPLWLNGFGASAEAAPALAKPANGATQCVEDVATMRASHMELLADWREAVVRHGRHSFTSPETGKVYTMSLTRTCLGCHNDRGAFCDRCHQRVGVDLPCWDCHLEAGR